MKTSNLFFSLSFILLIGGILAGILAAHIYIDPYYLKESLGFRALRPLHVSSVVFWILLGGTGCVYASLEQIAPLKPGSISGKIQLGLWIFAIGGIVWSYFKGQFGGREYWEFPPVWALPVALAWILFLVNFIRSVRSIAKWPVYIWMWMTGILFFLFIYLENYLWLFPYFRNHFLTDTTIQWKVNGSIVGSWNQILYGTAFFLMDRITGQTRVGFSRLSFTMYFLGLFNLMFNWGHHIYTLPTAPYIKYIGYLVSMTEWIFFIRILYTWKAGLSEIEKHYSYFPYRFLMASNFWVFLNMAQAILMSIPALNIYTHGTHITVAHAMGTTIGINSMIILAAAFMFYGDPCYVFNRSTKVLSFAFWLIQGSLLVFWLSLNLAGIEKGIWQLKENQQPFSDLMQHIRPYFKILIVSGTTLFIGFTIIIFNLAKARIACMTAPAKTKKTQFSKTDDFTNQTIQI